MAYNSIHRRIKQWDEPAYDKSKSTINQYVSCIIGISLGLGSHTYEWKYKNRGK